MSWVVGALVSATAAAMRERATRVGERHDFEPRPACSMSIVLVGVDPESRTSAAIDKATGSRGFSHVLFDPCRSHDGRALVVDYTMRHGVHWATLDAYAHRRIERVQLDAQTGLETWGCVRASLGKQFRTLELVAGNSEAGSCVGLIVRCLPWSLQEAMRPLVEGPCVSPNTLARFFGVAP